MVLRGVKLEQIQRTDVVCCRSVKNTSPGGSQEALLLAAGSVSFSYSISRWGRFLLVGPFRGVFPLDLECAFFSVSSSSSCSSSLLVSNLSMS